MEDLENILDMLYIQSELSCLLFSFFDISFIIVNSRNSNISIFRVLYININIIDELNFELF